MNFMGVAENEKNETTKGMSGAGTEGVDRTQSDDIFEVIDLDKGGTLDFYEVKRGIGLLGVGKIPERILSKLFVYIDTDKGGDIDKNEFWEFFKLTQNKDEWKRLVYCDEHLHFLDYYDKCGGSIFKDQFNMPTQVMPDGGQSCVDKGNYCNIEGTKRKQAHTSTIEELCEVGDCMFMTCDNEGYLKLWQFGHYDGPKFALRTESGGKHTGIYSVGAGGLDSNFNPLGTCNDPEARKLGEPAPRLAFAGLSNGIVQAYNWEAHPCTIFDDGIVTRNEIDTDGDNQISQQEFLAAAAELKKEYTAPFPVTIDLHCFDTSKGGGVYAVAGVGKTWVVAGGSKGDICLMKIHHNEKRIDFIDEYAQKMGESEYQNLRGTPLKNQNRMGNHGRIANPAYAFYKTVNTFDVNEETITEGPFKGNTLVQIIASSNDGDSKVFTFIMTPYIEKDDSFEEMLLDAMDGKLDGQIDLSAWGVDSSMLMSNNYDCRGEEILMISEDMKSSSNALRSCSTLNVRDMGLVEVKSSTDGEYEMWQGQRTVAHPSYSISAAHIGFVCWNAIFVDESNVVTCGADCTAKLWNLDSVLEVNKKNQAAMAEVEAKIKKATDQVWSNFYSKLANKLEREKKPKLDLGWREIRDLGETVWDSYFVGLYMTDDDQPDDTSNSWENVQLEIQKKTQFAIDEIFCSPTTVFYGHQKPVRSVAGFKPAGCHKVEVMFTGDDDGSLRGMSVSEIVEIKRRREDLQKVIADMKFYATEYDRIGKDEKDLLAAAGLHQPINKHIKWWTGIFSEEQKKLTEPGKGGYAYLFNGRYVWCPQSSPGDAHPDDEDLPGFRWIDSETETLNQLKILDELWLERTGALCYKATETVVGGKSVFKKDADVSFEEAAYAITPVQGFAAYIGCQGNPVNDISVNEIGIVEANGNFIPGEFVISASGPCIYSHALGERSYKMRQPKSWKKK